MKAFFEVVKSIPPRALLQFENVYVTRPLPFFVGGV